jgi:DNA processing protein
MPNTRDDLLELLTLRSLRGIGPVRAGRALARFGSAQAVLGASASALTSVEGIGIATAESALRDIPRARDEARAELDGADRAGATLIAPGDPDYPALLLALPDRPVVLYSFGTLDGAGRDRFAVGVVGARRCSAYGLEQAERFGTALGRAGLTVVSGGARGIDTASHRGAITGGGRTIAVLGCGLSHVYPPENRALFEQIAEARGAVVSELPMDTAPTPENFPARNRLISGMSLGVLVVEAGRRSGALITARLAAEEHGREVFAIPGRIDSEACAGSLELLKSGGAHLVTEPGDVIEMLELPARLIEAETRGQAPDPSRSTGVQKPSPVRAGAVSESGRLILVAATSPATLDEVAQRTGLSPADIRRELTLLELSGAIRREGARIAAR